MSLESKVGIARTGTQSLRATVPQGIVAFLELEAGDKLDWKMEIIGGQRVAIVQKIKRHLMNHAKRMNDIPLRVFCLIDIL